jgi:selenocysteine lyase/cysteine desulfurase
MKGDIMEALHERYVKGVDRRNFLKLTGLAAAASALSLTTSSCQTLEKVTPVMVPGPPDSDFWKTVQGQFVLDPKKVYMNVGTTGSMPRKVLANYEAYNNLVAQRPMDFMDDLGTDIRLTTQRGKLAEQFGCNMDEMVISRNTTDGLNTAIFGLPFERGDEILLTHHEHFSLLSPLNVLQDRRGIILKEVEIPVFGLQDKEQVIEAFEKQITRRTKAIVFSHIPYQTGVRLPAKEICHLARNNGLISVVDGAHCTGMIQLDFHDMGCDFYAASGHKWQCGAGATGILYIRNHGDNLPEFWAQNSCWYQMSAQPLNNDRALIQDIAGLFMSRGQDNFPAILAMLDACDMWEEIGRDRIEAHVCGLSSYLKKRIKKKFGDSVALFAPDIPEFTSGLTSFNPFKNMNDKKKIVEFVDRLKKELGYIVRFTGFHLQAGDEKQTFAVRISTHLFHDHKQIDGLVDAMHRIYREMA